MHSSQSVKKVLLRSAGLALNSGGEVLAFVESRNLLTLTDLLETSNNWCVNVDKSLLDGVIFIDLKKAFETIDHEIILQKLAKCGVDQDALKWFKSDLTNRLQRYNVNNHLSSATPLKMTYQIA